MDYSRGDLHLGAKSKSANYYDICSSSSSYITLLPLFSLLWNERERGRERERERKKEREQMNRQTDRNRVQF